MYKRFTRCGVVGVGMVGGAMQRYLEKKQGLELFLYDKGKGLGSPDDVNKAEVVFICVPTPYLKDGKGFDLSCVEESLAMLNGEKVVVIKSTVLPGTTEMLQQKYPQHKILMNPEFLTEETADQDMLYPDRQIVGYTAQSQTVAGDVMQLLPLAPFERILPATEAEIVKYFGNTWFSVKVSFANQMYDLCQSLGVDYDRMVEAAAADKRIGRTHLNIFHKGARGYGGKCLAGDQFLYSPNDQGLKIEKIENFRPAKVLTRGSGIKPDLVTHFGKRPIDKIIEIKLNKGRKIKVSLDHIMVSYDKRGKRKDKTAEDLTLDDRIPVVLGQHQPPAHQQYRMNLVDFVKDGKNFNIFIDNYQYNEKLKPYLTFHQYKSLKRVRKCATPLPAYLRAGLPIEGRRIKTSKTGSWVPAIIDVDKDFARLVGYYLAEGCSSDGRVLFSLGYREKEIIGDIERILNKFKIGYSKQIGYWEGHKSSLTVKVSSPILTAVFSQFGKNSYEKRIPDFIFSSAQEVKDNLLSGLFRGDGSLEKSNMGNYYTISYATVSPVLREGIDILLREKGILASFKESMMKKAKVKCFGLNISMAEDVKKLGKLLTEERKKKIFSVFSKKINSPAYQLVDQNLALLPIKEINVINKPQFVYSIENKNHVYLTSGGILTHNCLPKDIKALIQLANTKGVDLKLHKAAEEINNTLMAMQGIDDPEKKGMRPGF